MILRGFVILILVLALVVHNLPLLLRDQAVVWLLNHGAEKAGLKALEVNWLKGTVRIKGLYAEGEGKSKLRVDLAEVDLDYGLLADNRVLLSDLQLEGVELGVLQKGEHLWLGTIDLNSFAAEADDSHAQDSGKSDWSFGLAKMALSDINWRTELPGQKHHLLLNTAHIADFYLWDREQVVSIDLDGSVNGAPMLIKSTSTPLQDDKKSSLSVKLTQFPLHSVTAAFMPSLRAHVDLNLNIELAANLDKEVTSLQQKGSIRVRDFVLQQDGLDVKQDHLNWDGQLKLALEGTALKTLLMDSTLELKGLNLLAQGQKLDLSAMQLASSIEMQGLNKLLAKDLVFSGNGLQLNSGTQKLIVQKTDFRGELKSDDLIEWQANLPAVAAEGVQLTAQGEQLVTLEQLKLDQFQLQGVNQIDLKGVLLSDLKVMGDEGVFSQWGQVKGDNVKLSDINRLDIDRLTLGNSRTRVRLSEKRQLTDLDWLLARLAPEKEAAGEQPVSEPAAAKPFRVNIAVIELQGDNPISFVDQGVKPDFHTKLNITELNLAHLDTASKGKTAYRLKAQSDFSTITAKGEIELFSGNYGGNWDAAIKGLALPQVTPYALEYTGYSMQSGQLSLETQGTLKGRTLRGDMDIRLNNLEVEAGNSRRSKEFNQKLSMPLSTAIMILKDNKNNIDLQIPVDGSLDDPKFGYQAIINKLAGKGLKNAAMGYLTQALQPFGALISIGQMVVEAQEKGSFITLQPVYFLPGQNTLDAKNKKYIEKLAQMMNDRKGIRMNICGQAVAADQPFAWDALLAENKERKKPLAEEALQQELEPRLQQLAQSRSDKIKTAMAKRGIDIERLFICYPKVDLNSKEKPQVALGL
ncbi:MAG: hypothetical protein CSA61_01650 [Neptuniibacter caesariensis]|uniref:DUF748 domain-containing protein n=1 Tax=Neptuniibacter caesariensis TaxID=207954 RepID=A0A2G6JB06_NEPCE|nr:MAG: hypothetical protein CSA61_01650 [Neptuniibacter caesariensis]